MTASSTCARCDDPIRPDDFLSDRRCAFDPNGRFTTNNWQCPVANRFRYLALDAAEQGMWRGFGDDKPQSPDATEIRDNDERFVTLSLIEAGVTSKSRDLPAAMILQWYKDRGRTNAMICLGHDGSTWSPTITEIEHIVAELERAFPTWCSEFKERHHG